MLLFDTSLSSFYRIILPFLYPLFYPYLHPILFHSQNDEIDILLFLGYKLVVFEAVHLSIWPCSLFLLIFFDVVDTVALILFEGFIVRAASSSKCF